MRQSTFHGEGGLNTTLAHKYPHKLLIVLGNLALNSTLKI